MTNVNPNKKTPTMNDPKPISLISLDPAAAARSIDAAIAMKNDEKDFLDEKVWVQFYNLEQEGNPGYFKWGKITDPTVLELEHGEIKELTRAAIRFIESRQTPEYAYRQQGFHKNGLPKMKKELVGWKPRYQCRSVNRKGYA